MGDARIIERIAAWEARGVIDAALAARLRDLEGAGPEDGRRDNPISAAAAVFGPAVSISEMFGYLGTGFVLAAWYTLVGRIADSVGDATLVWAIGHALIAAAFSALAIALLRGPARARRAAGVAMLVVIVAAAGLVQSAGEALSIDSDVLRVVVTLAGLAAAVLFRGLHASLLTQFGLLAAITALAGAIQQLADRALFPSVAAGLEPATGSSDPIVRVVLMAGWWLLVAVVVGFIGLREAAGGTVEANRRAALCRAWAGLVAVLGVAVAIITMQYDPATFESRRILEPIVGDLVLVGVSGILLERAFRRDASAFVFPAGLGVILALTDMNASYLAKATSTEVGLFVEGVILLVAGFGFEQLRRRVAGGPSGPAPTATGTDPAPESVPS